MTDSPTRHSDQERAAAALHLARRSGDAGAHDLLQSNKIRKMRIRIVVVLGSLVVGAVVGFAFGHRGITTSRGSVVAHWRTVAGPTLMIAGIILEFIVIVARFRSGQIKSGWRSPSLVLSRRQRRQLLRQIRGQAEVDPAMLPVSRQLAVLLRNQRLTIGLFIALPMIFFGQALPHNVPFRWWLAIFLLVAYAVLSVQIYRDSARAQRFLLQYASAV